MSGEVTGTTIVAVIAGMALVNFALRFTPLAVLSRVRLPEGFTRWLSYVPASVMGALVASEVLRPGGQWQPPLTNPGVYAAVIAGVTFRFSKSFLGSTMAGVVSYVFIRSVI